MKIKITVAEALEKFNTGTDQEKLAWWNFVAYTLKDETCLRFFVGIKMELVRVGLTEAVNVPGWVELGKQYRQLYELVDD